MDKAMNIFFLILILVILYICFSALMQINKIKNEIEDIKNNRDKNIQSEIKKDVVAGELSSALRSKLSGDVSELNIKFQ